MVMLLALAAACGPADVTVEFFVDEGYTFSRDEQRRIAKVATTTVPEVRALLPTLPPQIVVKVRPWSKVVPETGEAGTWSPPNVVYWSVDPRHGDGPAATAERAMRTTLYHELHHVVRRASVPSRSIVDRVVTEGLATVFERDGTGNAPPWGEYPDDVASWAVEVMALPPTADPQPWMSRHPDGRRWIGYKVGAYLADCAHRASGRSVASLVAVSTNDLIALAREVCAL